MRLITTKQALVDCLGIVSRAASSRSSIQVLGGVLVEAEGEQTAMSATDMEISLRCPLPGRVEEEGALVVPARIMGDIARSLPSGEVAVLQRSGESQVRIQAGEAVFDLLSLPASDFPRLPVFTGEKFTVSREGFLETVERVAPAASRDETRPVLTGVLVHVERHLVRMVATDSYRLSVKETELDASVSDSMEAIIPAKSLTELTRIGAAASDERIEVTLGQNQALFAVGQVSLITRLIEGQFPNYRQLIPETFDYEVAVDREELLDAIRRVALLAQKTAPLRLRFSDHALTISAESQDVGRAQEVIPVAYSGEDFEIGFNPEFLEAGVTAVKDSTVYLRFISPLRPGLVKAAADDFQYLVMPIRLSD